MCAYIWLNNVGYKKKSRTSFPQVWPQSTATGCKMPTRNTWYLSFAPGLKDCDNAGIHNISRVLHDEWRWTRQWGPHLTSSWWRWSWWPRSWWLRLRWPWWPQPQWVGDLDHGDLGHVSGLYCVWVAFFVTNRQTDKAILGSRMMMMMMVMMMGWWWWYVLRQ